MDVHCRSNYSPFPGLTGVSIGLTFGMIRGQQPVVLSLSAGSGVFAISGVFFGESTCSCTVCIVYKHN